MNQITVRVVDESHAAGHASSEISTDRAEYYDRAAGHALTAIRPTTFHDGGGRAKFGS